MTGAPVICSDCSAAPWGAGTCCTKRLGGPASGTRRCLASRVLEAAEEIEGLGAAVRGVVPQAKRGTGVGWAAVAAPI